MNCQCEHSTHGEVGCLNEGIIQVSESYIICTGCERTMDLCPELQVTSIGKYMGMTWHMKERSQ